MASNQTRREQPWLVPDKWWVSPWNYRPDVTNSFSLPEDSKIMVVDSTLRSICTSEPGTLVSPDDLVEIAHELDTVGVEEAVFNISHTGTVSDLAFRGAQACTKEHFDQLRITSGCSLLPEEWRVGLDKAMEAGVEFLEVSYGAVPHEDFTGTPRVLELLDEAVTFCRAQGIQPSIAFNVHRDTDLKFVLDFCRRASSYQPRFLRLYDTKTALGPEATRWLVETILERLGPEAPRLVIHTHNSWGLATASTISAVLGGAQGVDVAALAIGTKSGHAPLEEVVLALEALYGLDTGIDLSGIDRLTSLVSRIINKPIHANKPIVGENAYLCEQGPSVVEAIKERVTGVPALTPFSNAVVGQKKRIVWGKNTLKRPVVKLRLQELGVEATDDQVDKGLAMLSAELETRTTYPAWLDDEEAAAILRRTIND